MRLLLALIILFSFSAVNATERVIDIPVKYTNAYYLCEGFVSQSFVKEKYEQFKNFSNKDVESYCLNAIGEMITDEEVRLLQINAFYKNAAQTYGGEKLLEYKDRSVKYLKELIQKEYDLGAKLEEKRKSGVKLDQEFYNEYLLRIEMLFGHFMYLDYYNAMQTLYIKVAT